jgi:tRNA (guanine37-N1)-methyltransferase
MQFDIISIFPDFFKGPLDYGIVRRAREASLIDVGVHDLREHTHDRHRTVDDRPFGGGEGMLLKPEPLFEAVETLAGPTGERQPGTAIVLLSASGKLFRQEDARRFAGLKRIILLCGRYEGVDERVAEHLATDELSVGDFVLSGGELAAALVLDSVTRLLPGALGNEDSSVNESFSATGDLPRFAPEYVADELPEPPSSIGPSFDRGGLDCPHYTRPAEFRGWQVPAVLMGGNHEEIRRWRIKMALEKTRRNRPDLLSKKLIANGSKVAGKTRS